MERKKEKAEIIADLQKRVDSNILERNNFDLLKKLIENADNLDEAIKIAELGTTYKRTGFHFDKRLERQTTDISYFKKNTELSFETAQNAITHKLIIGDNYPALLNLLIQYKGEIDVIYIDPPYGKDKMGEFAETNYDNAITRDNLLSMLYPRLYLAKQLLSDNGVIFCSIDDKNQAYVKGLFDEVFDEQCFVASVIWKNKFGSGAKTKGFIGVHEYILVYTKNTGVDFARKLTDKERTEYNKTKDEKFATRGGYVTQPLAVTTFDDRPSLQYPVIYNGQEILPKKQWVWSKEKMELAIKNNEVVFNLQSDGTYNLRSKKYLIDEDGCERKGQPTTFYTDVYTQNGTKNMRDLFGSVIFDYTKPVELMKYFLALEVVGGASKDCVVLDFFAGSGTTGQAVLELNKEDNGNRQFILVTNNEKTDTTPNGIAIDVTSKRLKRVMTGKCYGGTSDFEWAKKNKPLGDNLEVLEIAEVPNFEHLEGKTPFDVIDETLYGKEKLSVREKVEWVCDNFEITQKKLSEDK